jgi:hypothetical protein
VVIEGSTLNAEQQTAYLALGARGLGIANVSQFQMQSKRHAEDRVRESAR